MEVQIFFAFLDVMIKRCLLGPFFFSNRTEKCYHAIRHKPVTTRIREAFRSNDYPYEKDYIDFALKRAPFID